MELVNGRPADCAGRLPKEIRCYDLLDVLLPAMEHAPRMVTLSEEKFCARLRPGALL